MPLTIRTHRSTLTQFLIEERRRHPQATGDLNGLVTGVSIPLHVGRTLATFQIVISDDAGRRVCTARLSCVLREQPG